jgi:hypothetical protein
MTLAGWLAGWQGLGGAGQCRDDVSLSADNEVGRPRGLTRDISSSEKREAGPAAPLRIQLHPALDDQEGQNGKTGQPHNGLLVAAAVRVLFRVKSSPLQSLEGVSQLSQ